MQLGVPSEAESGWSRALLGRRRRGALRVAPLHPAAVRSEARRVEGAKGHPGGWSGLSIEARGRADVAAAMLTGAAAVPQPLCALAQARAAEIYETDSQEGPMAEYVVAGVTGHTGSVVAQTLLDSGRKVRVLVRDPHKAERWKKRGAHVGQADLASAHDLLNALRGTEAAFFLLPPFPPNTTGVRGKAKKMIDAMVQAIGGTDVKHVVFVSSMGAHHADGTGPVVLLHDAEQELRTLKTPVTFLRPCYFMENWAPALPDAKEGLLNTFLPAELKWSPRRDARRGADRRAQLLLEHPKQHRVVELAGPEDVGPADVARVLSKLLGTEVEPMVEPLDQVAEAFTGMGFSPEHAAMYQHLYQGDRLGAPRARSIPSPWSGARTPWSRRSRRCWRSSSPGLSLPPPRRAAISPSPAPG